MRRSVGKEDVLVSDVLFQKTSLFYVIPPRSFIRVSSAEPDADRQRFNIQPYQLREIVNEG